MIFRPYYHFETGCAAYLFGCPTMGKCAVVDAHEEEADAYVEFAAKKVMTIVPTEKSIRTGRVNVRGTGRADGQRRDGPRGSAVAGRDAVAGADARPAGGSVPTAGAPRALAGVRPLVGTGDGGRRGWVGRRCADRVQGR